MPRINRIRLINYGWANRRIDDLILDFHGGMNAEIRLGNGGGKSVLQRLIYQAVFPNTTVSNNRIEDYLKDKPAMSVIEWLLDSDGNNSMPERITTGTVLYKSDTKEDSNSVVHYFTFLSNDANHLSLDHLPNVDHEAGTVVIEAYSVSQNKYRNLANNYPEVFYYASDERKKYHQKMEAFGISVNNWKEVILPMISTEDPFTAFLKNSKKTDQLIDGYLLSNIEKHLSRNSDNKAAIRGQLNEVVEMMSRKKDTKDLRDLLESYIEEYQEQDLLLDDVLAKKQDLNQTTAVLAGFERSLLQKKEELEAASQELNENLRSLENELHMIQKEEVSLLYHDTRKKLEAADNDAKEKAAQLQEENRRKEEIDRSINRLYAKSVLDEINELNGQISALKIQYEGLDQSEKNQRLAQISATLYARYSEELCALEKTIAGQNSRINEMQEETKRLKAEKEEANQERNRLFERIGRLEQKRKQAEKEEADLMKDLGSEPLRRDFLNQLLKEEISLLKETIQKRISDSEQEMTVLKKRIEETERQNQNLDKQKDDLIAALEIGKGRLLAVQAELDQFNTCRHALLLNMERYGISESFLYDPLVLKREYSVRHEKNTDDNNAVRYQIQLKQELLVSAKNGNMYIPNSVTALLDQYGINYQTGENFLSEQKAVERKKYLKRNPFLPFSILLDRIGYEKLQKLDLSNELIRQIIPVYCYSELDKNVSDLENYLFQVKEELLETKQKKNYLESIEQMIEQDRKKLDDITAESERLADFQRTIERFSYSASYEQEQQTQIKSLMTENEKTENQIEQIRNSITENRRLIQETGEQYTNTERMIREQKDQKNRFDHFLEENEPQYQKILNDLSQTTTEKDRLETEYQKKEKQLEERSLEIDDLRTQIQQNSYSRERVQTEKNKYMECDSFEPRSESTQELTAEFDTLSKETSREKQDLLEQIQSQKEREKAKRDTFATYAFKEEELEGIRWSSAEAERLKALQKETAQAVDQCEKADRKAAAKAAEMKAHFKAAEGKLREAELSEPLQPEQIRMHFDERRTENKQKKAETVNRFEKTANDCRAAESVLANLSALRISPETEVQPEALTDSFVSQYDDLRNTYDQALDAMQETLKNYQVSYRRLKDRYYGENPIFEKVYNQTPPFEGIGSFTFKEAQNWKATCLLKTQTLGKTLDMYNADLENLENAVTQLINSAVTYTKRVGEALRQISKQSMMKIAERTTPVRLLRIDLKDDLPDSPNRLETYLREGIRRLTDLYDEKSSDLEKEKDNLLKTRTMLNKYLDQVVIPVRVYRFDENSSHSGLVDWEKAAKSNSTGEHSTSCFVIIAAMMAYTRGEDTEMSDFRTRRYEPIICDNPFASISSEYLVQPIITIVDHLNLQLISFTHNTQQSIANSFDVVIQLRNTALRSGRNRIDVDRERVLEEKMEHAALYSNAKQLSMF